MRSRSPAGRRKQTPNRSLRCDGIQSNVEKGNSTLRLGRRLFQRIGDHIALGGHNPVVVDQSKPATELSGVSLSDMSPENSFWRLTSKLLMGTFCATADPGAPKIAFAVNQRQVNKAAG